jgi:SecY
LGAFATWAMITAMADPWVLSRNPDLLRRIGVTFAALAVYRVGCWIPLPGVDVSAFAETTADGGGSGAVFARASIMALGIIPLLSVMVLVEAAMLVWPQLRTWSSNGRNRARLDTWVVVAALIFAGLQASGIAAALEDVETFVPSPGPGFRAGIVVSLVAATAFVIWLASFITRRGVGSGFWILVAVPHVTVFTEALLAQSSQWGSASPLPILLSIGFLALATAVFILLTRSAAPLANTEELVWAPVLGLAIANWLFGALLLLLWLAPLGDEGASSLAGTEGTILLPLICVPLALILRRRSFGVPLTVSSLASAAPVAGALAVLVGLGTVLLHLPTYPITPGPVTTLILAAVGLAVADALNAAPHTPITETLAP